MSDTILVDDHERVRLVTFNRPDAKNAFDRSMWEGAHRALHDACHDDGAHRSALERQPMRVVVDRTPIDCPDPVTVRPAGAPGGSTFQVAGLRGQSQASPGGAGFGPAAFRMLSGFNGGLTADVNPAKHVPWNRHEPQPAPTV